MLEDWLWEYHRIFVLLLPARSPEWNPIKFLWNCLEACLSNYEVRKVRKRRSKRVVIAAADILSKITHTDVEKFYNKSGVFDVHRKK